MALRSEPVYRYVPKAAYPSLTDEQAILIWSQDSVEEALRIARSIAEGRWSEVREELIYED